MREVRWSCQKSHCTHGDETPVDYVLPTVTPVKLIDSGRSPSALLTEDSGPGSQGPTVSSAAHQRALLTATAARCPDLINCCLRCQGDASTAGRRPAPLPSTVNHSTLLCQAPASSCLLLALLGGSWEEQTAIMYGWGGGVSTAVSTRWKTRPPNGEDEEGELWAIREPAGRPAGQGWPGERLERI